MATASPTAASNDAPVDHPLRWRWRVLLGLTVLLGAALATLATTLVVSEVSGGTTSILIGAFDSPGIAGLAIVACLLCLAAGVCLVSVSGKWLLLLVPVRIIAIAMAAIGVFWWLLTAPMTVVPLLSAGCDTGYVVAERSFLLAGGGTVYRVDGLLATRMTYTSGDDGYLPFADGAYTVLPDGPSLDVWYDIERSYESSQVSTSGAPAFSLPQRSGSSCPNRALPPPPSATSGETPAPMTVSDAETGLRDMLTRTLQAASAPVLAADGAPLVADSVAAVSAACEETGVRLSTQVSFSTSDNAASLERILAEWDSAGYLPDRAMQEDLRYSETLPIQRMSIRDRTTIDGLVHLQITTRCASSASPQ